MIDLFIISDVEELSVLVPPSLIDPIKVLSWKPEKFLDS